MSESCCESCENLNRVLEAAETLARAQELLDLDELRARHKELEGLRAQIDLELVTVEGALRAADAWSRPGRPRKVATHSREEAMEAHRRWLAGERSDWIDAGHQQYERESKRNRRMAKADA